jgi:hypothetical protein
MWSIGGERNREQDLPVGDKTKEFDYTQGTVYSGVVKTINLVQRSTPMIIRMLTVLVLAVSPFGPMGMAQEETPAAKSVAEIPDGVSHVKTNPDGSLKSLLVKATVERDPEIPPSKRTRDARDTVNQECRSALTKWLLESGRFYREANGTVVFFPSSEKPATPANSTLIEGTEARPLAIACGSKLLELASQREGTGSEDNYVAVMGLKGDDVVSRGDAQDARKIADNSSQPRPFGPPRSLEDDAPRRPALRRSLATESEAVTPEKPTPAAKLEDFL